MERVVASCDLLKLLQSTKQLSVSKAVADVNTYLDSRHESPISFPPEAFKELNQVIRVLFNYKPISMNDDSFRNFRILLMCALHWSCGEDECWGCIETRQEFVKFIASVLTLLHGMPAVIDEEVDWTVQFFKSIKNIMLNVETTRPNIVKLYAVSLTATFVNLIADKNVRLVVRKVSIVIVNHYLPGASRRVRMELKHTLKLERLACQVVDCGDYEFQHNIIELLFRFIRDEAELASIARHITQDDDLVISFVNINLNYFDRDVRCFLSNVNMSQGAERTVYSLKCTRLKLGRIDLASANPDDREFWIDFNLSDNSISITNDGTFQPFVSVNKEVEVFVIKHSSVEGVRISVRPHPRSRRPVFRMELIMGVECSERQEPNEEDKFAMFILTSPPVHLLELHKILSRIYNELYKKPSDETMAFLLNGYSESESSDPDIRGNTTEKDVREAGVPKTLDSIPSQNESSRSVTTWNPCQSPPEPRTREPGSIFSLQRCSVATPLEPSSNKAPSKPRLPSIFVANSTTNDKCIPRSIFLTDRVKHPNTEMLKVSANNVPLNSDDIGSETSVKTLRKDVAAVPLVSHPADVATVKPVLTSNDTVQDASKTLGSVEVPAAVNFKQHTRLKKRIVKPTLLYSLAELDEGPSPASKRPINNGKISESISKITTLETVKQPMQRVEAVSETKVFRKKTVISESDSSPDVPVHKLSGELVSKNKEKLAKSKAVDKSAVARLKAESETRMKSSNISVARVTGKHTNQSKPQTVADVGKKVSSKNIDSGSTLAGDKKRLQYVQNLLDEWVDTHDVAPSPALGSTQRNLKNDLAKAKSNAVLNSAKNSNNGNITTTAKKNGQQKSLIVINDSIPSSVDYNSNEVEKVPVLEMTRKLKPPIKVSDNYTSDSHAKSNKDVESSSAGKAVKRKMNELEFKEISSETTDTIETQNFDKSRKKSISTSRQQDSDSTERTNKFSNKLDRKNYVEPQQVVAAIEREPVEVVVLDEHSLNKPSLQRDDVRRKYQSKKVTGDSNTRIRVGIQNVTKDVQEKSERVKEKNINLVARNIVEKREKEGVANISRETVPQKKLSTFKTGTETIVKGGKEIVNPAKGEFVSMKQNLEEIMPVKKMLLPKAKKTTRTTENDVLPCDGSVLVSAKAKIIATNDETKTSKIKNVRTNATQLNQGSVASKKTNIEPTKDSQKSIETSEKEDIVAAGNATEMKRGAAERKPRGCKIVANEKIAKVLQSSDDDDYDRDVAKKKTVKYGKIMKSKVKSVPQIAVNNVAPTKALGTISKTEARPADKTSESPEPRISKSKVKSVPQIAVNNVAPTKALGTISKTEARPADKTSESPEPRISKSKVKSVPQIVVNNVAPTKALGTISKTETRPADKTSESPEPRISKSKVKSVPQIAVNSVAPTKALGTISKTEARPADKTSESPEPRMSKKKVINVENTSKCDEEIDIANKSKKNVATIKSKATKAKVQRESSERTARQGSGSDEVRGDAGNDEATSIKDGSCRQSSGKRKLFTHNQDYIEVEPNSKADDFFIACSYGPSSVVRQSADKKAASLKRKSTAPRAEAVNDGYFIESQQQPPNPAEETSYSKHGEPQWSTRKEKLFKASENLIVSEDLYDFNNEELFNNLFTTGIYNPVHSLKKRKFTVQPNSDDQDDGKSSNTVGIRGKIEKKQVGKKQVEKKQVEKPKTKKTKVQKSKPEAVEEVITDSDTTRPKTKNPKSKSAARTGKTKIAGAEPKKTSSYRAPLPRITLEPETVNPIRANKAVVRVAENKPSDKYGNSHTSLVSRLEPVDVMRSEELDDDDSHSYFQSIGSSSRSEPETMDNGKTSHLIEPDVYVTSAHCERALKKRKISSGSTSESGELKRKWKREVKPRTRAVEIARPSKRKSTNCKDLDSTVTDTILVAARNSLVRYLSRPSQEEVSQSDRSLDSYERCGKGVVNHSTPFMTKLPDISDAIDVDNLPNITVDAAPRESRFNATLSAHVSQLSAVETENQEDCSHDTSFSSLDEDELCLKPIYESVKVVPKLSSAPKLSHKLPAMSKNDKRKVSGKSKR